MKNLNLEPIKRVSVISVEKLEKLLNIRDGIESAIHYNRWNSSNSVIYLNDILDMGDKRLISSLFMTFYDGIVLESIRDLIRCCNYIDQDVESLDVSLERLLGYIDSFIISSRLDRDNFLPRLKEVLK